jgi:hypothetical protein
MGWQQNVAVIKVRMGYAIGMEIPLHLIGYYIGATMPAERSAATVRR